MNNVMYDTKKIFNWCCPECGARNEVGNIPDSKILTCPICGESFFGRDYGKIKRVTVAEACKVRGIKTYDTNPPQKWINAARSMSDIEPIGNVVWAYKTENWECLLGCPIGITPEGDRLMCILAGAHTTTD